MKQNLIHIGLAVDDTRYHGAAFNKGTAEVIDFKCDTRCVLFCSERRHQGSGSG